MWSSSLSARLSKITAAIAAVLCASSVAAQNNLTVADLKAYGDDGSTATHALLSDDKITFTDTGGATGILTWDSAGTEFEMDNDLKLTAGGFWIGSNQIIDSSRNFGNINNSTGSTNVVFSDTPTLATPNWTGTATGVGLTLSGSLSAASTTFTGSLTLPDGTASAPGLRFTTDADSGFYQSGDGYLDVAIAGSRVARFGASEFWSVSDIFLNGAADIIFDVDRDTYLASPSDDVLDFYIGAARAGGFDAAGDFDLVGDLAVVNIAATGTITGMTNVTGSGSIVLASSPTLTTPNIGAATGTSLTLSGGADVLSLSIDGVERIAASGNATLASIVGTDVDVAGEVEGDSISINGTTVIDDSRETYFVSGGYSGTASVGALSSSGGITGTTGFFSGDLRTNGGNLGRGIATPTRPLHVVIGNGTLPTETVAGATVAVLQNNDDTSDQSILAIISGSSGDSVIMFGDSADENPGQITYNNTSNELRARTNAGSTAATIDSSGLLSLSGARITLNTATASRAIIYGAGSPESSITASPGALYLNTSGGTGTTLYVKESGTGNTGWIAK